MLSASVRTAAAMVIASLKPSKEAPAG